MKQQILITDLTDYNDLHCVAGFNVSTKTMVRPEPHAGGFWQKHLAGRGTTLFPGNLVEIEGTSPIPPTPYPHFTEDRVLTKAPALIRQLGADDFRRSPEGDRNEPFSEDVRGFSRRRQRYSLFAHRNAMRIAVWA